MKQSQKHSRWVGKSSTVTRAKCQTAVMDDLGTLGAVGASSCKTLNAARPLAHARTCLQENEGAVHRAIRGEHCAAHRADAMREGGVGRVDDGGLLCGIVLHHHDVGVLRVQVHAHLILQHNSKRKSFLVQTTWKERGWAVLMSASSACRSTRTFLRSAGCRTRCMGQEGGGEQATWTEETHVRLGVGLPLHVGVALVDDICLHGGHPLGGKVRERRDEVAARHLYIGTYA